MAKHSRLSDLTVGALRLHLPANGTERVYVYYPTGQRAMQSTVEDVMMLATRGMVIGRSKSNGHLHGVYLRTSIRAALKLINECRRSAAAPPKSISINRGSMGRKRWVVRLDRADTGTTGGPVRTLHMRAQ